MPCDISRHFFFFISIMKILSNRGNKDYYDFYSGIMGIDNLIVYDRRKCINSGEVNNCPLFAYSKMYNDKYRNKLKRLWSIKGFANFKNYRDSDAKPPYEEGEIYHYILVIGMHYYFFEVERYLDEKDNVILNYWLLEEGERNQKMDNLSTEPIFFAFCDVIHRYWEGDKIDMVLDDHARVWENPILRDTYITKVIPPETVWKYVYEYLSSLRDKPIVDTRTDLEHLESHGFDKKKSFRHRK